MVVYGPIPSAGAPPIAVYKPAQLPVLQRDFYLIPSVVIRLTPPAGKELVKVIATKDPVDFSPLLYLPPSTPKGVKKSKLEDITPRNRPLAELLDAVRLGDPKGVPESIDINWTAAAASIEVEAN